MRIRIWNKNAENNEYKLLSVLLYIQKEKDLHKNKKVVDIYTKSGMITTENGAKAWNKSAEWRIYGHD